MAPVDCAAGARADRERVGTAPSASAAPDDGDSDRYHADRSGGDRPRSPLGSGDPHGSGDHRAVDRVGAAYGCTGQHSRPNPLLLLLSASITYLIDMQLGFEKRSP